MNFVLGSVAQLAEQLTLNHQVVGSIPTGPIPSNRHRAFPSVIVRSEGALYFVVMYLLVYKNTSIL